MERKLRRILILEETNRFRSGRRQLTLRRTLRPRSGSNAEGTLFGPSSLRGIFARCVGESISESAVVRSHAHLLGDTDLYIARTLGRVSTNGHVPNS